MREWWPDEQLFAGAEHLDPAYVAGYEAKAQFDPADDIEVLRSYGLGPGSTVVDLGAGTGVFAAAAAGVGAAVTAVDVSPAMAASMRSAAPSGVTVVEAGFLSYDHENTSVDFVFSRNALHQLPDFWKVMALRRIAGMLRPGGILRLRDLVYELEPHDVDEAFDAWLTTAADDPTRGYTAGDLSAHIREEFSTFTWLLEPMLEHAGFEILDREVRRSVFGAYTCRRR